MKKLLILFAALLVSVVIYAQRWEKTYHPADEMLSKLAYNLYTYKTYDFKLYFDAIYISDTTAISGSMVIIPNQNNSKLYGVYTGKSMDEVLIGYYDKNNKYLKKESATYHVNLTHAGITIFGASLSNTQPSNKPCVTQATYYLESKEGYIRLVFPNGADVKIPCFNND